jgi:hypothetical protein
METADVCIASRLPKNTYDALERRRALLEKTMGVRVTISMAIRNILEHELRSKRATKSAAARQRRR